MSLRNVSGAIMKHIFLWSWHIQSHTSAAYMSPNSRFWHRNKNLILTAKWRKIYTPGICCANSKGPACLTNQSGNQKFTLLHALVIACRPGRYSRDTNHSSPWPQTIYAQFAHTTHFVTHMLFFGLQTAQTLKIHIIRDVTQCRCVNSSWHFKDTMILQNMGNYLRSDTNIPKERQKAIDHFLKESV